METSVNRDLLSTQNNIAEHNDKLVKLSAGQRPVLPPINGKNETIKDYLPQNLLVTLTQACSKFDDLGPNSKHKGKIAGRHTDNVWHHEKTRGKLKHLSEQPPCHCGAGSDISYLLDAAVENKKSSDIGEKTSNVSNAEASQNTVKNLMPESIIPSEFHIIKHKGALGLEIHDEKYTTQVEGHEEHLTVFPSMKPSGRQEALQLMQTMNKLLKKAGVTDKSNTDELVDNDDESSQIEKLLKLVKEEQMIYNIVFNEVIRQVSIDCIERGTVLAELRKRYAKLLESVPRHVKSLHEEVLAQRALDRRLTEKLSNFKTAITLLTKELHEIHAHDEEVTKQAVETQAELNEALKESEKNASLLAEYHDLYELQRRRLDYQLSKLMEERDLWAGAAHMLSLKVTAKHNLVTIRRLHLYEKAWYKLANNFAVLLGHEDEKQLQVLAGHVHRWQEITESFNDKLLVAERESCERIRVVESSIAEWAKKFERVVTPDEGTVHPPDNDYIEALFNDMKSWEEVFNHECERFMGDVLLSCEDDLLQLNKCVDLWIQTAVNIFRNHPTFDGCSHPQHVAMMELNTKVEKLHGDFKLRMSGENGIAKIFIQLLNNLDTWINKVNAVLNGGETLFDSEWLLLADLFQVQWKEALGDIIDILSCDNEKDKEKDSHEEKREAVDEWLKNKSDVFEVYEANQKWLSQTISGIENEDCNIVEQVATTHSNMVRWTITILLRIAPDTELIDRPNGKIEEDSSTGLGAAILEECTSESIINRAVMLFNWLRSLTDLIVSCLRSVFTQNQLQKDFDEQDKDQKDLRKIEDECIGWMNTANLLISEVTGDTIPMKDFLPPTTPLDGNRDNVRKMSLPLPTMTSDSEAPPLSEKSEAEQSSKPAVVEPGDAVKNNIAIEITDEDAINMHVIGHDENVKKRRMMSLTEHSDELASSSSQKGCDSPSLSLEDLQTMKLLQEQLMETERRAQNAEEKAFLADSSLKDAEEKIRSLERTLKKMEVEYEKKMEVEYQETSVSSVTPSEDQTSHNVSSLGGLTEIADTVVDPKTTSSSDQETVSLPKESNVIPPAVPSPEVFVVDPSGDSAGPQFSENVAEDVAGNNPAGEADGRVTSSLCSISPSLIPTPDLPQP